LCFYEFSFFIKTQKIIIQLFSLLIFSHIISCKFYLLNIVFGLLFYIHISFKLFEIIFIFLLSINKINKFIQSILKKFKKKFL